MRTYIKNNDGDILYICSENSLEEKYICRYLDNGDEIDVKYPDVVVLDTNESYVRNF